MEQRMITFITDTKTSLNAKIFYEPVTTCVDGAIGSIIQTHYVLM